MNRFASDIRNIRNNLPWWVIVALVIIAVLSFAHTQRYFSAFGLSSRNGGQMTILQASLEDATSDVLSEWSPLVVQDRLVDPIASLSSTLLRWQFVWKGKEEAAPVSPVWIKSVCRFTVIYSKGGDVSILLKGLEKEKEEDHLPLEVRLSMGRCLILPPGILYSSVVVAGVPPSQVRLHDSVTALLSRWV